MRAMDLDAVEARQLGALGRGDEVIAQHLDFRSGQAAYVSVRNLVRRHRRIDERRFRPASRMVQLQRRQLAFCPDPRRQRRKTLNMLLAEHPDSSDKALPNPLDMRRSGHRQRKSPCDAHLQPMLLDIRQAAIRMALPVGECEHEVVLHRGTAGKRQRFEQLLRRDGGSSDIGRETGIIAK